MTYDHLYEKMLKEQAKFMPGIERIQSEGKMPEDLAKALAGIEQWNTEADQKLGNAEAPQMAPNIDPVNAFSNALGMYSGMFTDSERGAIQRYQEYAEAMFNLLEC